jgi:sigma-B regulation protein RsbU (phosphoserine phosphatase)
LRILVAEDENVSRTVLETSLKKRGHEVVALENGLKAWQAIEKQYFPVIISDWLMPEMDGLALFRKVRSVPRDNYIYLVLLTSLEGKTNYLEAMDAGADEFLTKPFDTDQLTARMLVAERILGVRQHVSQLEGLLPICCSCKKIRDGQDNWQRIENYIEIHSEARFTHGYCPECCENWMNGHSDTEK